MAAITLENLSKHFGAFAALKELHLEVRDHEFMALLGPSGCGKTTTMNLISGLLHPSAGRILFDARDVTPIPMGRRGVGFVFQNYAIFTHMTVRDNLAFGLRVRRLPHAEIDRRVGAIAEMMQLTKLLDSRTDKLSVNILQRIAIGRSAIVEPAIFLLDEPLSNVDAAFRQVMRTELKTLQRQFKQTMVYVTHDQLEAMTMADRIAVLDQGVLQQVGSPLEIYNHPRNVFVARFIGSPGMNLLNGRLSAENGQTFVDLGPAGRTAALSADLARAAERAKDRAILVGIRPEDLECVDDAKETALTMAVSFVERIGHRTVVHLGAGAHSAKMTAHSAFVAALGSALRLRARAGGLRLFDQSSGLALAAE
jgi:multiple sugar transport system ATP-binding protein